MRHKKGYCTNSIFDLPNLIRGIGGEREGFSLPFALTITQVIVIFAFGVISFLLSPVWSLLIPGQIARVIVAYVAFPVIFGYLVGQKEEQHMNILRYYYVKWQSWQEPKELIRFEEVEQSKMITIKSKIKLHNRGDRQ